MSRTVNTCIATFRSSCERDVTTSRAQGEQLLVVKTKQCLRGGGVERINTPNVTQHLQIHHTKEYDKYVQALGAKEKCQCLKQKCEKLASISNNASKVDKNKVDYCLLRERLYKTSSESSESTTNI